MTSDDDLLRSWAEATDPEHDPISSDEVRFIAEEIPLGAAAPTDRRRRVWSLAAAAVVVVAVGAAAAVALTTRSDERSSGPTGSATSTTETTDPPDATDVAPGRLVAEYSIPEEIIFIEGALQFVEVRLDGEVVESRSGGFVGSGPVIDVEIDAGLYEVEGWLYQCPASCPEPQDVPDGERTEICIGRVEVEPERTTSVELRPFPAPDDQLADCEVASGRPVQVVVSTGRLPMGREGFVHTYALRTSEQSGEDEVVAAGPVRSNDSQLVVDGPLPAGGYELVWEWFDCPATCPAVASDGRPLDTDLKPLGTCVADLVIDEQPILEIHLRGGDLVESDLPTTCAVEHLDEVPELTVPPAWTMRQKAPQACDDGSLRVPEILEDTVWPGDQARTAGQARRRCFAERYLAHEPVELRFLETVDGPREDADDGWSRWVTWRAVRGRFTVVAEPTAHNWRWTRQNCDLEVGPGPDDVRPGGCGVEQELSLDPP